MKWFVNKLFVCTHYAHACIQRIFGNFTGFSEFSCELAFSSTSRYSYFHFQVFQDEPPLLQLPFDSYFKGTRLIGFALSVDSVLSIWLPRRENGLRLFRFVILQGGSTLFLQSRINPTSQVFDQPFVPVCNRWTKYIFRFGEFNSISFTFHIWIYNSFIYKFQRTIHSYINVPIGKRNPLVLTPPLVVGMLSYNTRTRMT